MFVVFHSQGTLYVNTHADGHIFKPNQKSFMAGVAGSFFPTQKLLALDM